jgi:hypothetical protein
MKHVFTILMYLTPLFSWAQLESYTMGGRGWGIGNATATLSDEWAIFNNVGGIGQMEKFSAMFAYDNRFGLTEFQTFGLGFVAPIRWGVAGLSVDRFGDDLYNETKIGLGYAYRWDKVNFGLKANYAQISFADLGSKSTFILEFGGQVQLSKTIRFGVHIYNFSQALLKDDNGEEYKIPTVIKGGLAYSPLENLLVAIETQKDLDLPAEVRAGVEYGIWKYINLRTGIQVRGKSSNETQSVSGHFGLGFKLKQYRFDYALGTQSDLGLMHHVSFAVQFGKVPKKS